MPSSPAAPPLPPGLLDPAAAAEARAEVLPAVPLLPSSDEGVEAEFFYAVYKFARDWLRHRGGPAPGCQPCAFVRLRAVNQEFTRLGVTPIDYFQSLVDHDVAGAVFVASGDLALVGRVSGPSCKDVARIAATLRASGLGDCMHAVFRPDTGCLILSRSGLGKSTSRVTIELGTPIKIEPLDLERYIWEFHLKYTQTPSGALFPWIGSPKNRVTVQELERRISANLCLYLNITLRGDYVATEHYTDHGRLDIKVGAEVMLEGHGSCALELKVLRSRLLSNTEACGYTTVSLAKVTAHALSGVEQADVYRERIGAGSAYLCCFDCRFADEDQPDVARAAALVGVKVRRYFMYDSPESHREARAAARRAGTLLAGQVN